MPTAFNNTVTITLQDELKRYATILAKSKGLDGFNPLVRLIVAEYLENRKLEIMQKILFNTDGDQTLTLDKFNQEIDRMINSA